jgi:hypothetical protein
LGEYYEYTSNDESYEEDEGDSDKYDNCDCLRSNPLSAKTEKCLKGLDQDSFNDEKDKKSKRSVLDETLENGNSFDWRQSSSLSTLKNFNMNSIVVKMFSL